MKKSQLKLGIACAALVVAAVTGTACAAPDSAAGSGSRQPLTEQSEQLEESGRETPRVIEAAGPNVFPHSLDYDAPSRSF